MNEKDGSNVRTEGKIHVVESASSKMRHKRKIEREDGQVGIAIGKLIRVTAENPTRRSCPRDLASRTLPILRCC